MLPSAAEIVYFIQVADSLNLSRAAERLGVSQPALSLAIKKLENNVGTNLLVRSKSGVQLTKAGQQFLPSARELLQKWESIKQNTLQRENEVSGNYTLGCHPSVGLYALGFIPTLLKKYPKLSFQLKHGLSRHITEQVISFQTDFAIVVNPVAHPDLIIKPLLQDEVSLWTASKSSKLQKINGEDSVLIADPDLLQSQSILKQLQKAKIKFNRHLSSGNLELICSLVADGSGVGILPSRVAKRFQSLQLKRVKNAPVFKDNICLVFRADMHTSAVNRQLAKEISQSFS